jgi:hypothetical protein
MEAIELDGEKPEGVGAGFSLKGWSETNQLAVTDRIKRNVHFPVETHAGVLITNLWQHNTIAKVSKAWRFH